jgi:hypothetical protein
VLRVGAAQRIVRSWVGRCHIGRGYYHLFLVKLHRVEVPFAPDTFWTYGRQTLRIVSGLPVTREEFMSDTRTLQATNRLLAKVSHRLP